MCNKSPAVLMSLAMVLMIVVENDKLMRHQNYSVDMVIKNWMMAMDEYPHLSNDPFQDVVYQIFYEQLMKHWNFVEHNNADQLVNIIVHHRLQHYCVND